MSTLIFSHIVFGSLGIASGLVTVAGMFRRKRMDIWNAVFLSTTAMACATGFVFLRVDGVTSAQLVGFFTTLLLTVAAYSRYVRRLHQSWMQIYAFTAVGALFLNILIAIAKSFLHFRMLTAIAPTQHSPVYIAVKLTLLLVFVVLAIVLARRAGNA